MEHFNQPINDALRKRFSDGNPDLEDIRQDLIRIISDIENSTQEEEEYFQQMTQYIQEKIDLSHKYETDTIVGDDFLDDFEEKFNVPNFLKNQPQVQPSIENNQEAEEAESDASQEEATLKKQKEMLEKELVEAKTERRKKPMLTMETSATMFVTGLIASPFVFGQKFITQSKVLRHKNIIDGLSNQTDSILSDLSKNNTRKELKTFFDNNVDKMRRLNQKMEALDKFSNKNPHIIEDKLSEESKKLKKIQEKLINAFKDKELFDLKDHEFMKQKEKLIESLKNTIKQINELADKIAEKILGSLGLTK